MNARSLLRVLVFALGLAAATLVVATPAMAVDNPYTTDQGSNVEGNGDGNQVLGNKVTNTGSGLAVTGGEAITLAIIGAGLIGGGVVFVTAARRKSVAA